MLFLADAAIRGTYDKKGLREKTVRPVLEGLRHDIQSAHKVYLDSKFCKRVNAYKGTPVPFRTIETFVSMAFLPFDNLWIEFPVNPMHAGSDRDQVMRVGYLLKRRSPDDSHNWTAMMILPSPIRADLPNVVAHAGLVMYEFSTEGLVSVNDGFKDSVGVMLGEIDVPSYEDFIIKSWGFAPSSDEHGLEITAHYSKFGRGFVKPRYLQGMSTATGVKANMIRRCLKEQFETISGTLYHLAIALAFINNTPVTSTVEVTNSKYFHRGKLRPYMQVSTMTIDLDDKQIHKILHKEMQDFEDRETVMRRHVVRGHYRIHKSFPGVNPCKKDNHVFEAIDPTHIQCQICQQVKSEVREFEKGDASKGWSSHKYLATASES